MKKLVSILLVALMLTTFVGTAALAAGDINVSIDGEAVVWTDAKPFIDSNNRTLVPLRAVAEAMGLEVEWDGETRTASFTRTTAEAETSYKIVETVSFVVDKAYVSYSFAEYDGEEMIGAGGGDQDMDTAAVIVNDRTYAPVRYLAEAFDYEVDWDAETSTVLVDTPSYVYYYYNITSLPDCFGITFVPGERFEEYKSVELLSATVNGEAADFHVFTEEELSELRAAGYYTDAFYAFNIYADFESETEEYPVYEITWTLNEVMPEENEATYTYTWTVYGYGGW